MQKVYLITFVGGSRLKYFYLYHAIVLSTDQIKINQINLRLFDGK